MKNAMKRAVALALALVMALSLAVTAQAADDVKYRICQITPNSEAETCSNIVLTPLDANGKAVAANEDGEYRQVVKFSLTFTGTPGQEYVVFLLSDGEEVPKDGTIRYIDQVGADAQGSVQFPVFPDSMEKGGTYNVCISSGDGYEKVASFVVYTLGDVNQDGNVTAYDASLVLQYAAEMIELTETQKLAADTDHGGTVTAYDASLILQYAAEMIEEF